MTRLSLATLASLAIAGFSSAQVQFFTPPGSFTPSTISGDGTTAVGWGFDGSFNFSPWQWTSGGGVTAPALFPGHVEALALSSSFDGSTVVGYGSGPDGINQAMRWTNGTPELLSGFDPTRRSFAFDTSSDGSVIVGSRRNAMALSNAYTWTSTGGPVALPALAGDDRSEAYGVTGDGSVAVGYSSDGNTDKAVRWVGGVPQDLGSLPTTSFHYAYDVSGDGNSIVGEAFSNTETFAFIWTDGGGMQEITPLAGDDGARALSISNDGLRTVGESFGFGGSDAILWDPFNGTQRLQDILIDEGAMLGDWTLTSATSISADGTIILGEAINSMDENAVFVAQINPIPEPGSLSLLALGGLALLRRRV